MTARKRPAKRKVPSVWVLEKWWHGSKVWVPTWVHFETRAQYREKRRENPGAFSSHRVAEYRRVERKRR